MEQNRVAIVEDESIVALDISTQLRANGYDVVGIYPSGEAALSGLADSSVDIVLLDIRLHGDLDGIETAQLVKARFGLPVILLTAYGDEATLQRAKLAQPFAFILKPVDARELRSAIVISLYRHSMEQVVREREELFSTTLERIQDAVIVTDDQLCVRFTNTVAESLIGVDTVQSGVLLSSVCTVHGPSGELVDPTDSSAGPFELRRGDGTVVPIRRHSAPMHDGAGNPSGWVFVLHDISEQLRQERELREREDQLRRAQKMEAIGRLTGGIAHDFNNLLTVILGYTKLLRDEVEGIEQAIIDASRRTALLDDIDGIQKAAVRSASLTRQLLAFSRHQKMERRAVSVNDVVADMQKMLLRLVGDGVTLRVDLIANPSVVFADPSQIEQVLMNLVVNARDAMPDGGVISIRSESQPIDADDPRRPVGVTDRRFVILSVRDRGCGMTPDVAERIFEPFYTTKGPGEGTGLGLSTVYGIVTQSGGFIDLDTEPGRGTAFTVFLPSYTGESPGSSDHPVDECTGDGTETILLVEDEEPLRELFERVLSRRGYTVVAAASPGEALLSMESRSEPIDAVIADISMPLMNGVRLVERMRTAEHPQLLHHRPHRPRQEHAGRPPAAHDRHHRRPRHAGPEPGRHGPGAGARHHHQEQGHPDGLHPQRAEVHPEPDRYPGPRGLQLRGEPLHRRLRRGPADRGRDPGHQAQTISNLYLALEHDLEIIPILNKMDLPSANPEEVKDQIMDLLGCKLEDILSASGKTGLGVDKVLEAVVDRIPAPKGDPKRPLQALIFDSVFNPSVASSPISA
jgi:two-component system, cell cycle sensor histidine kinase and response regulator CckA